MTRMQIDGRLAALLLRRAARASALRQTDWARAMCAEAQACSDDGERLRWAAGCWFAGLVVGLRHIGPYLMTLATAAALVAAYEWRCDEGLMTVVVIASLSLALGAAHPRRAMISGLLIGLVVSGVLDFEALSGVRPAYESQPQSLAHGLRWSVFVVPALATAALGAWIGRRLPLRSGGHG